MYKIEGSVINNNIGVHKPGKLCLYFVTQLVSGAHYHVRVILSSEACRTLLCSREQHGVRHKHPGLTSDKPSSHLTFTKYLISVK